MEIRDESVLDRFRGPGRCEWCGKQVSKRDPHHIYGKGFGGASQMDIPINLISLCQPFSGGSNCHAEFHLGHIMRHDLLAVVAAREGRLQDEITREIFALIQACGKDAYRQTQGDVPTDLGNKPGPLRGSAFGVGKRDRKARMEDNEDEDGRLAY